MGEKKTHQRNNKFCLYLVMRRKDIEGTFCACKNLDSQDPVRMKNIQKLQTCTWYQRKRICGKSHNLQWLDGEYPDNCAPEFSGLIRLMSSPNTSLGAFAELCLSCVYRAESLLAEGVQDGWCSEHWPDRHVRRSAVREGCQELWWAVSIVNALLQLLGLMLCSSLKRKK